MLWLRSLFAAQKLTRPTPTKLNFSGGEQGNKVRKSFFLVETGEESLLVPTYLSMPELAMEEKWQWLPLLHVI